MFIKKNLMKNEYFPLELPICFNSKDASENIESIVAWTSGCQMKVSIPSKFSGFKNLNARRNFAIPNIYHYAKTIKCIVENSNDIFSILEKSEFSLSKPIKGDIKDEEPYCKKTYNVTETRYEIERIYKSNTYEIKLDISSFFDSIYTHSIPWAIHGISAAKKEQCGKLFGNAIDKNMRNMNHGETNGVLVGNAISRIISEILLCKIDNEINIRFNDIECKRFVDDYYIYTKDPYKIQGIISYIRSKLGEYKLLLNEGKIIINESPFSFGKEWVEELKLYIHLEKSIFLNKMINLFKEYKDISILRYGLTVISWHSFEKKEWVVVESKLINIWVRYSSLAELVSDIFYKNIENLQRKNIKEAMYCILDKEIELNHDQEIIWVIWMAKIFNIKLKSEYIEKIITSENSICIIIILDMLSKGELIKTKELVKKVEKLLLDLDEENIMISERWLLAYEVDRNKWGNEYGKVFERARNDNFFKNLIRAKIEFYNPKLIENSIVDKYVNEKNLKVNEFEKYLQDIDKYLKEISSGNEYLGGLLEEKKIKQQRDKIMKRISNNTRY